MTKDISPAAAPPAAPPSPPLSAGMLGGALAGVLWALAWVGVACVATERASRSPTAPAVLGAVVSIGVAAVGCFVAWCGLRSDHRWAQPPGEPESFGRRATGWIAGLFWCGVGAAWNVGIFGWLFLAAAEGRGGMLTFLVPWSLVGWLLLVILLIGLGSIVDWAAGALGLRAAPPAPPPPK